MSTNLFKLIQNNQNSISTLNSISLYIKNISRNLQKEDSLMSHNDENIVELIEIMKAITLRLQRINDKMKHYNISESDIIRNQRFIRNMMKLNGSKKEFCKKKRKCDKNKKSLTWNKENSKSK